MDTLAFGYALPAIGRARDFHPLETCACSAHDKERHGGETHAALGVLCEAQLDA